MTAFWASVSLAWRAVMRAPSFRWCALGGAVLATLSGSLLHGFLVFEDRHSRVELVASTLHLWTVVCGCLIVPPRLFLLGRRRGEESGVFDPNIPFVDVTARGTGVFLAYATATALLGVAGWIAIVATGGDPSGLAAVAAAELLFGAVLLSGALALSQIGTTLSATAATVAWFILGTIKHTAGDGGAVRWAAAWIPDFVLLQPTVDSDTSPWTIAYGGALIALHLGVGAALGRLRGAGRPARL